MNRMVKLLIPFAAFAVGGTLLVSSLLTHQTHALEVKAYDWGEGKGSGTEEDPYLIDDSSDFKAIAEDMSAYYKLNGDIYINDYPYVPLGDDSHPFVGNLDGDGHSISGLRILPKNDGGMALEWLDYRGLFAKNAGVIKNLTVGGKFDADGAECSYIGLIAGRNDGTIENCVTYFQAPGNKVSGTLFAVGSIAGYNTGTITGCIAYPTGDEPSSNDFIHGHSAIGGIAGFSSGTITNCVNYTTVSGNIRAGGIVGQFKAKDENSIIKECYNEGAVITYTAAYDYNQGMVGGIAGSLNGGTIQDCYNLGAVSGRDIKDANNGFNAGGIVGKNESSPGIIQTCYNYGLVQAKEHVGGILGAGETDNVTLNYYVGGRVYVNDVLANSGYDDMLTYFAGATLLSADEFKQSSSFPDLDFENVWARGDNRPVLQNPTDLLEKTLQGYGTEEEPIQMSCADDFIGLGLKYKLGYETVVDKYFVLTNDVDLSSIGENNWVPIGNSSYPFEGHFDGDGYNLSGLIASNNTDNYVGLFGYVDTNSVITNFSVKPSGEYGNALEVVGSNFVGAIAGYNEGTITKVSLECADVFGAKTVGGIAGYNAGTISYCTLGEYCDVQGATLGGIVGISSGMISDCSVLEAGQFWTFEEFHEGAGGIVGVFNGYDADKSYIVNCLAGLNVQPNGGDYSKFTIGAIVGKFEYSSALDPEHCFYFAPDELEGRNYYGVGQKASEVITSDNPGHYESLKHSYDSEENEWDDVENFVGFDFDKVWGMGDHAPFLFVSLGLDDNAVATVKLIDAIGTVEATAETKGKIEAAETSFSALNEREQAVIYNYDVLLDARVEYDILVELKSVSDKIAAIDEKITNTKACKDEIDAAKKAYDDLSGELQARIDYEDVNKLNDALQAYDRLHAFEEAVKDIGDVYNTAASKAKIETAEDKYSYIYWDSSTLSDGVEDTYLKAKDDYNKLHNLEEYIADIISENPLVYGTALDGNQSYYVTVSRSDYDDLPDYLKPRVANYDTLLLAESVQRVQEVIDQIEYIPTPWYSETFKEYTDEARAMYEKLSKAEQAKVSNYQKLVDGENRYVELGLLDKYSHLVDALEFNNLEVMDIDAYEAKLKAASDFYDSFSAKLKEEAQYDHDRYQNWVDDYAIYKPALIDALKVTKLIDDIGTLVYNETVHAKYDAAQAAADKFYEDYEGSFTYLITNWEKIQDAEAFFEIYDTAKAKGKEIVDAINAIGKVEYTPECSEAIQAARNLYDEGQKYTHIEEFITNYDVLLKAEADYLALIPQEEFDKVDAVKAMIDALGEITYTPECKASIDAATEAYYDLPTELRPGVTNYNVLEAASQKYAQLESDETAVSNTIERIDMIGEVTYSDETLQAIAWARASYDYLSDELKAKVTNYEVLVQAEAAYAKLEKEALDAEKVKDVVDKIDAIGEVTYSEACLIKLNAARYAYDNLSVELKAKVTNYQTLLEKEKAYRDLVPEEYRFSLSSSGVELIRKTQTNIPLDITLKVATGADVSFKDDASAYAKVLAKIAEGESILVVYTIELNREGAIIQPADISPFNTFVIRITKSADWNVQALKILHIHNADDIEAITFAIEGDEIVFEVDRLSEFVFVQSVKETPTPVDPTPAQGGLSAGAIVGIVLGSVFGLLIIACAVLVILNKTGVLKLAFVEKATNAVVGFFVKIKNGIVSLFKKKK